MAPSLDRVTANRIPKPDASGLDGGSGVPFTRFPMALRKRSAPPALRETGPGPDLLAGQPADLCAPYGIEADEGRRGLGPPACHRRPGPDGPSAPGRRAGSKPD
jgi:hypothetical protein